MRAYRSPGDTRLSAVFSAATTRMQSAGQAAAQSEQPTHFSSPFSWRGGVWRPRERGETGPVKSGGRRGRGVLKVCLKVGAETLNVAAGSRLNARPPPRR